MLKSARNVKEVGATALDLAAGRYPPFVYGAGNGPIPVFCFHSAEPESFERQMSFLSENGYVTLTADEYLSALLRPSLIPPKSVLLTFDDGWGSLWSIGFPILKRYGLKITIFLVTGRITDGRKGMNLEDLPAARCAEEEVVSRDASENPLLTWDEVQEMHQSGLVDFQSHSHTHSLVCKSPRILDFVHPGLLRSYGMLELPTTRLGEPLYESAPRLSDVRRFSPDPRTAEACALLAEGRGPDFFLSPGWRVTLREIAFRQPVQGSYESEAERAEAVRFELTKSRRTIEARLPGKEVRHICYPWHEAGSLALRLSRDAGYRTNFLGKVGGRYYTRKPSSPMKIARVSGDYLFRLPGKGRVSLISILAGKLARRMKTGSAYLTH